MHRARGLGVACGLSRPGPSEQHPRRHLDGSEGIRWLRDGLFCRPVRGLLSQLEPIFSLGSQLAASRGGTS
jgi:hypothetical protein